MQIIMPGEELGLLEALHRADLLRAEARRNINHRRGIGGRRFDPVDAMLVDFMAEIFPDEGLDIVLGQWPKNDTRLSTTYLCLFTSQTATTVITSGQNLSNITETTYTSYARQSLAAATWGAAAAGTGGRKSTYSQITFPTVGTTGATINGAFIGEASTPTKCICQANFDDGLAAVVATNDVIKDTPTIQFNN